MDLLVLRRHSNINNINNINRHCRRMVRRHRMRRVLLGLWGMGVGGDGFMHMTPNVRLDFFPFSFLLL
jgi:hypothetical protein